MTTWGITSSHVSSICLSWHVYTTGALLVTGLHKATAGKY